MHRCPDCAVEMKETNHTAHPPSGDGILLGTGGGIKTAFRLDGMEPTAYVCPECRLVRFYAE